MDLNETLQPEANATIAQEEQAQGQPLAQEANEAVVEPTQKVQTKEEAVERLKALCEKETPIEKNEIDSVKKTFYQRLNAEIDEAKRAFADQGGDPEAFVHEEDPLEVEFKNLLEQARQKRAEWKAADEQEKQANYERKLGLLEQMKQLCECDDINNVYQSFKKLQAEWREIKNVPETKASELWKSYQVYAEKFYDVIKLNNEFREYDFRKNLDIKTRLCEAAENLATNADVVSAFHQLQKLHQEYRETGPVAKDLREGLWTRFKAASTVISRAFQQHYDEQKEQEQQNYDQKVVICEIVEATEFDKLQTIQDWNKKTEEIQALQNKWRTIGYAPQKVNAKVYERFRNACNDFFKKKNEFLKGMRLRMNENMEKKIELCKQAEALKDSTDWKATADILVRLQKEWKAIGPTPRKQSSTLWERFSGACDSFFERKNKETSSQRNEERQNLANKRNIISQMKSILEDAEADYGVADTIRELMQQWNAIGHVPFKEKDNMFNQYHELVDELYRRFDLGGNRGGRRNNYRNTRTEASPKNDSPIQEKDRLLRQYETLKLEIQTYENNIGFLSASSRNASSIISEMEQKVQSLKDEFKKLQQKIEEIQDSPKEE